MRAILTDTEKYEAIGAAFSGLPPGSSQFAKELISAAARTLCRMRNDPRQRAPEEEEKRLRQLPPIIPSGGLSQKDWDLLSRQPRPRPIRKRLDQFEESAGRTLELLDALKDILPLLPFRSAQGGSCSGARGGQNIEGHDRRPEKGQPREDAENENRLGGRVTLLLDSRTKNRP